MMNTEISTILSAEFSDFLTRAKVATYASDGAVKDTLEDGAEQLTYSEGALTYRDRYYGSDLFAGQEVVFLSGKAIWSMTYYGYTPDNRQPAADVIGILKAALRAVTREAPFRGPSEFEQEGLRYTCSWEGNVAQFQGEEIIARQDRTELRLVFCGGALK